MSLTVERIKELGNKSSCTCESCRRACTFNPGWFLPEEAEKTAKFLGITLNEFFQKYLGVNWWVADNPIFVLAPAIISMTPGNEYPANPRGTCVFFKNNECKIHPFKPFECREYIHNEKDNGRHEKVANAWNFKKYQDQINFLLGRDPKAENYSIFDMFDF